MSHSHSPIALWKSLAFPARLAGLTTLLVLLTLPLGLNLSQQPTHLPSKAASPPPSTLFLGPPTGHRPNFLVNRLPSVVRGHPYTYRLPCTDPNPQDHLTLTAKNLPAGLKTQACESPTNATRSSFVCPITGTTTVPTGTYLVTFRLSDSVGNVTIKQFPLKVVTNTILAF